MNRAYRLSPVQLVFGGDSLRADKLRGLQEFGPYSEVPLSRPVSLGFVFPDEYRDHANRLYLALRNGIGYFKGVEHTFRLRLERSQVSGITGFSIKGKSSPRAAESYVTAIRRWIEGGHPKPDLMFVIHPQTATAELDTPYYECKALLLQAAVLSQNVTGELIQDSAKFQWSAANIALGAFVKLGGTPWLLKGKELEGDLIIGVGRSYLYDAISRELTGFVGFTACFSARGNFKFMSVCEVAKTKQEYLELLKAAVSDALHRADSIGHPVTSLTIHLPKEMSRDEARSVHVAAETHRREQPIRVYVARVSEDAMHFVVDEGFPDGIPRRGTVIQLSDRDYLVYTEGREEKEPWGARLPVALRVTPQDRNLPTSSINQIVRQVNDLSQVNWRGLNARSQPISVYYGTLIARLLSHIPADAIANLHKPEVRSLLQERMWFL